MTRDESTGGPSGYGYAPPREGRPGSRCGAQGGATNRKRSKLNVGSKGGRGVRFGRESRGGGQSRERTQGAQTARDKRPRRQPQPPADVVCAVRGGAQFSVRGQ